MGALSIPLIFTFHPRLRFDREWKYALPAIVLVAIPFILWDAYFTRIGIWGFNDRYLSGGSLLGLPWEEVAFFICIPYACLYTYHCFRIFFGEGLWGPPWRIHWLIPLVCIFFLGMGWDGWYTRWTAISLLVFYLFHLLVWRSTYLNLFLMTYAVLLIPFLITNGILTGTGIEGEVVWYNPHEHLGLRILTIPVEDVFYGLLMVLASITIWEKWRAVDKTDFRL
ncbi:lycopene cyclase domain-containing protein [Membranicola marinus]|uniref:Lycopene cyclase domain-containing protein n=1 Tax=Membranihabitans marinus TaxID=1227546 RepID=A0A953HYN2_9BACT|nr:lycopene cyclase domain-containing protein [Membranihabitans marinus]